MGRARGAVTASRGARRASENAREYEGTNERANDRGETREMIASSAVDGSRSSAGKGKKKKMDDARLALRRAPGRRRERASARPSSARVDANDGDRNVMTSAMNDVERRGRRRIAIFVEPSPFSHVSGMKNRFLRLIENLRDMGDDVVVITPDRSPPEEYYGAKVIGLRGFVLPFYGTDTLLLSFGFDGRVAKEFKERKPDLVHCAVPGGMINGAMWYCKTMNIPLVQSYHTHIPHYIPRYTWAGLVKPMWDFIRFWNKQASTMLVTSSVMEEELRSMGCKNLQVWDKGVDTVAFNPKFKSEEMRKRLTAGRDGPVIGCVGRLGAEKNLYALKTILEKCPGVNLAIIGDGPERPALEKHFQGTNTVFTGMITGDDLAAAYASLDVFVMPSESETLGFVVMESMASGVPVVAVAAGGLLDIVTKPGEIGLLYPSGDYDKAAEHVRFLLGNDLERERMGKASRLDVEKWGWMSSNQKLREQQYKKALTRFFRLQSLQKVSKAIGVRRRVAAAFDFLVSGQYALSVVVFAAAVSALLFVRQPVAAASKVKAAFGAAMWLQASEAALNSTGPVLAPFILTAMTTLAAIIPFVPTQPLFIMAGLFFGPTYGAAIGLTSAILATSIAASASRARGYRQVSADVAQAAHVGAPARRSLRAQLKKVNRALNGEGDAVVQGVKVAVMRLLPHAPFTVTNYLLGLTRVPLRAIIAGTTVGMAPWVTFYAFIGANGRGLLESGARVSDVAASLLHGFHIPNLLTTTELALVVLCGVLLLLRPASPAEPFVTKSSRSGPSGSSVVL